MTDTQKTTPPADQRRMLEALLSVSDEGTRAMFWRTVALKRRQAACPHDGGWLMVGARHASCTGCGLVALQSEYLALIRWEPPAPLEPAEALGTALALWRAP